ncbi:MAG: heparan N-sulfatase [Pirellulaceae bacterium]|nr:MAG: heparan N-sulfatase [Pirellulaceae bacterium]
MHYRIRRWRGPLVVGLILGAWLGVPATTGLTEVRGADQPNFLIIMADDCTFSDLPAYGGRNAKIPNLDSLAAESLVFDRAYLCSAMCQPCRAELFSGQYPMRNGCAWNHSASRPTTRSLPHYLRPLGYRVGLAGKVHVKPRKAFPFESVDGYDANCVRNPTKPHEIAKVREFMLRDPSQPFCLVVALVEPHVPWVMGDPSLYRPEELELPPHIADTPRTREDFARYLAEITYMDGQVGELLETLEVTGLANNTVVLFTSEQGSQFPGCKWTNWDTGVHTALMVRWPGRIQPGRTEALVQYADIAPTLLEIAGGQVEGQPFDGASFRGVLEGKTSEHRQFVYGMHNNFPEGPPFPIRSISDGRYHYIRNLAPERIYIEKHVMGLRGEGTLNNPYWGTWVWHATEDPRTYGLVQRFLRRPAEELYDLQEDPAEMNNRMGDPTMAEIGRRLREELDAWMASQGDPGIEQDTPESHAAANRLQHRFIPPAEMPPAESRR